LLLVLASIAQRRSLISMTDHRRERAVFILAFVVLVIGAGAAAGTALARTSNRATAIATTVSVIAGKPSELAFKLTKSSELPLGQIAFKVTNEGVSPHDFKICKVPVATTAHNACAGVGTKILKPGQSAVLVYKFTKKGVYEYLCTEPGHAAAGMKGQLGIGVAVTAPKPKPTTTTTSKGKNPCPNGETIAQVSPIGDNDPDNSPGGPDDKDGCL
jgi:uncharacterized cupredoxin-like copper-binding protein